MTNLYFSIHELLPNADGVDASMRHLVDAHEQAYPSGNWSPLRKIDYDREIPYLQKDWFRRVIAKNPPAKVPVAGLWFGLFNPIRCSRGKERASADFYLAGARQFQLDSEGDWAVQPKYFPKRRYANSRVLPNIHRAEMLVKKKLDDEPFPCLSLGYVCFVVKQLLAEANVELMLRSDETVGVAVGWDSGDPLYIGFVTPEGFQVRDPHEAIAGFKKREEEFERMFAEEFGEED